MIISENHKILLNNELIEAKNLLHIDVVFH